MDSRRDENFGELRSVLHGLRDLGDLWDVLALLDRFSPRELEDEGVLDYVGRSLESQGLGHQRYDAWARRALRRGMLADAPSSHLLDLSELRLNRTLFNELQGNPHLAQVISLRLRRCTLDGRQLEQLLSSPYVRQVRYLDVRDNVIDDAALETLAASLDLPHLRHLRLGGNPVGDRGVAALATAEGLPQLEHLDLRGLRLSDGGAVALAQGSLIRQLTSLDLRETNCDDHGLAMLLDAAPRLTRLSLDDAAVSGFGIAALVWSQAAHRLAHLGLGYDWDDREAREAYEAILESERLVSLRSLHLQSSVLETVNPVELLARSALLGQLQSISLRGGRLSREALAAMRGQTPAPNLLALSMIGCEMDEYVIAQLPSWEATSRLKALHLGGRQLAYDEIYAWAESPAASTIASLGLHFPSLHEQRVEVHDYWGYYAEDYETLFHVFTRRAFPMLRELDLRQCQLRLEDIDTMANSPTLAQLEDLRLPHRGLHREALATLLGSRHLSETVAERLRRRQLRGG